MSNKIETATDAMEKIREILSYRGLDKILDSNGYIQKCLTRGSIYTLIQEIEAMIDGEELEDEFKYYPCEG